MSVVPFRVAFIVASGVLVMSITWIVVAWPSIDGFLLFLASVAVAAVYAIWPVAQTYAEGSVRRDAVVLRRILLPRKVIAITEFDNAVVIPEVTTLSSGGKASERVLLRKGDKKVVAFALLRGEFANQLRMRDIPMIVDWERLSARRARKRYPGVINLVELVWWVPLLLAPVLIFLIWMLIDSSRQFVL